MVGVYRSDDRQQFLLMHLAKVDPGHYVGWGELDEYSREQFLAHARDVVLQSLAEFPMRNGENRQGRLKMKGRPPVYKTHDLVRVRAPAPGRLELIPYRRGAFQHERIDERMITVNSTIQLDAFVAELEGAFARGAA